MRCVSKSVGKDAPLVAGFYYSKLRMMFLMPDFNGTAIADLLPHTGPARLLVGIVRIDSGFIEAIGVIPATHPLAGARGTPCFLGLELGAQAAAAQGALHPAAANGQRTAQIGQVARVREADFFEPDLPIDTPIRVTARLEGTAPPLAVYRVSVSVGSVEYLRGVLSTHSGPP